MYVSYIYAGMGWLRSVRSIKVQVICTENSLFNRALLQKRPIISSILLTEATPYTRDTYIHVKKPYIHVKKTCISFKRDIHVRKRDVRIFKRTQYL